MDYKELQRILLMDKPSQVLRERKEDLAKIIPEFKETFDFDQKSIWHQYDVFEHTMHVVDEVMPDPRLRLAALFHDIGKPRLMTIDDNGQGHFYYHWEESENIFINYQDRFELSEEDIYLIRKLIFYHDLTIKDDNTQLFIEEFDNDGLRLLLDLKRADTMAHNKKFIPERLRELDQAKNKLKKEQKRLGIKDEEEKEIEKVLLLAILCKNSKDFSFKTANNAKDFIVGINTIDGILTFSIPIEFWNYFDIPDINNISGLDVTPKYDRVKKLKSILDDKTNSKGKRQK